MEQAFFGLEEEVFITEPEGPTLRSLYYLARLLKKNPGFYYFHSASNFARGRDVREGLMSGVEISTGHHASLDDLMADLSQRRRDLGGVCSGLIVPLGHLINYESPTRACAFQVHVGGLKDKEAAYARLTHFLPILVLIMVNSPYVGGSYFGQSYRLYSSFAVGDLRPDWKYRFQDIILTRRLGTIEIRVFDPIWNFSRIRILLELIMAIVNSDRHFDLDLEAYNLTRRGVAKAGFIPDMEPLLAELSDIYPLSRDWLQETPSNKVRQLFEAEGLTGTYSALDSAYRGGPLSSRQLPDFKGGALDTAMGVAGYYVPKIPFALWKVWREWH